MGARRAEAQAAGLTLDAGALIALERGNGRMIALLGQALKSRCPVRIPAGVVAQVWRDGSRQAVLARLLRAEEVSVAPLDLATARACGTLCGASDTADVVDASVVLLAKIHGDVIVTSDPDDLRKLDPSAPLAPI